MKLPRPVESLAISNELLTLNLGPYVVTLEDWGHELIRAVDELGEWTVNGFHGILIWMTALFFRQRL
jgi:hypothetical protein